jgi:hypothetical protein
MIDQGVDEATHVSLTGGIKPSLNGQSRLVAPQCATSTGWIPLPLQRESGNAVLVQPR